MIGGTAPPPLTDTICVWKSLPVSHHITLEFSLSDEAERGKFTFSISVWLHFGAAFLKCSQLPIHVPLESRHVAGFGPFGGVAYRWLPFTCIRATQIGKQVDPCYPLDCDNHSRLHPVAATVVFSVFANFLRSRARRQ